MPDLFLELHDDDDESGTTTAATPEPAALELLRTAEFSGSKLIPWGSNYSFAVALEDADGRSQLAIYKPRAGEAPLHDFPDGTLYLREQAAYVVSRWLGWGLVPPTVVRDGPHGVGSVQLYIEPTPDTGESRQFWGSCSGEIEPLVLFDQLINNADRKIGHCLRDASGRIWGIDHGLAFNRYPKLRTVLWQFVGEPISPPLLSSLRRARRQWGDLCRELGALLDQSEIEALTARLDRIIEDKTHPSLNPRRNVPYGWW